jgi:GcrA cell cycle regulator
MSWTEERVEMLRLMWTEGKSASQIAKELGGVTRNAVIGKVHRLGLSNRGPGVDRPDEPERAVPVEDLPSDLEQPTAQPSAEGVAPVGQQAATAPKPAPRDAGTRPKPAPVPGQPLPPQPPGSEISEEALANLAEVEKKAKRLTLMQLTERTCKWPVGDPATDDFWFCGLPSTPGKPYCETHVAVAFQPMSARRDRRSGR